VRQSLLEQASADQETQVNESLPDMGGPGSGPKRVSREDAAARSEYVFFLLDSGLTLQEAGVRLGGVSRQRAEQLLRPDRHMARKQVFIEKRKGVLIAPKHCESCDVESGDLHAHHKDYSMPLDVEWLCRSCHSEAHLKPRLPEDVTSTQPAVIPALTCQRCGSTWEPRTPRPVQCPRCKSTSWNKPKQKKRKASK